MKTVQSRIGLKNILFATDFEAPASRALPFAVALASHFGSRLFAVHVIPREAYAIASPDRVETALKEAREHAHYALNQAIGPLRYHGLQCVPLVGEGEASSVINAFVYENEADLLVVGTSSRAGFGKVFLGSVAEVLIREAHCPVLTVGPNVTTPASSGVHNIMCATDFSSASQKAVDVAVSLANEYEAHLTFVHVIEGLPRKLSHLAIQLVEKRMRDAIPSEPELFYEPQLITETGAAGERLVHLASDLSVNFVIMGVHGVGAAHTASHFGSIAHKVISQATCPVLTVADFSNDARR